MVNERFSRFWSQFLISSVLLLFIFSSFVFAQQEQKLKGQVTGVAKTIQTITVDHAGKKINIKYDKNTVFEKIDPEKIRDLQGQEVEVTYSVVEGVNIAKKIRLAVAELPPGVKEITTSELYNLITKSPDKFILIDSRPETRYRSSHIPSAISIPTTKMEKEGEKTLPFPKDKTLVFYCGGPTCPFSPKAGSLAIQWGFKDVRVYMDGEPGWKKAGYHTESTADFIQKENIVLIDLREPAKIAKTGYIPKAVNIPFKSLSKSEDKFPSYSKAPIVVYSDKKEEIPEAVKIIKKFGYNNVTGFSGGVEEWTKRGFELKKDKIPTTINYVRTYRPHEVSIADFEKALKDGSAVILDVRTKEEFAKGHFKGAINIPVDEIPKNANKLPKDKPIYVHCATGVRAEMGYNELVNLGFKNAKVLIANVEFEGEKYTITE